ncbi:hypothetical protein R1flu_013309 [Riccia fluitans]|uniref:Uncharacterized protein n=1 Tax=Riccia fluitans TaxID=41844 RepID=A0ABD1YCY8_9MARC
MISQQNVSKLVVVVSGAGGGREKASFISSTEVGRRGISALVAVCQKAKRVCCCESSLKHFATGPMAGLRTIVASVPFSPGFTFRVNVGRSDGERHCDESNLIH